MKTRTIASLMIAAATLSAAPLAAVAGDARNPIFGNAKVEKVDNEKLKSVMGQNTTSAYYAYLGNFYSSVAIQYGSYGAYLENFGSGYQSTRNSYYLSAYRFSATATNYYYYAYYYN